VTESNRGKKSKTRVIGWQAAKKPKTCLVITVINYFTRWQISRQLIILSGRSYIDRSLCYLILAVQLHLKFWTTLNLYFNVIQSYVFGPIWKSRNHCQKYSKDLEWLYKSTRAEDCWSSWFRNFMNASSIIRIYLRKLKCRQKRFPFSQWIIQWHFTRNGSLFCGYIIWEFSTRTSIFRKLNMKYANTLK